MSGFVAVKLVLLLIEQLDYIGVFRPPLGRYSIFPSGELHVRHVQQSDALSSFSCRTKHRLTGLSVASSNPARIIVTG
ncbi:t-ag D1-type domain-containing protein [Trichonephila clavipes]|nr:t-ag D1-type domain-containing protein [Trichonephila clavipes]